PVRVEARRLHDERRRSVLALVRDLERPGPDRGTAACDRVSLRERPVELGMDGRALPREPLDEDPVEERRAGADAGGAHDRPDPRLRLDADVLLGQTAARLDAGLARVPRNDLLVRVPAGP